MDFGKAFTYLMEDERWLTKLLIGTLVMLAATVVIIPFVLLIGYQIALMRNVQKGLPQPLPEWDDWGALFKDGLNVTLAMLVYSLPYGLLLCVGFGVLFLPILGAANEDMLGMLFGVTFAVWAVLGCLMLLGFIVLLFLTPAVYVQYVRTNDLAALFRVKEVVAIARDNASDILLTAAAGLVVTMALSMISTVLASTICGLVLALPLSWAGPVWMIFVLGHMYGQIARKIEGKSTELGYH